MVHKIVTYCDNEFCATIVSFNTRVALLYSLRDAIRERRSTRDISRPPQLLSRCICQTGIFSGSFISNPDVCRGLRPVMPVVK